jgi:hypothetical protein
MYLTDGKNNYVISKDSFINLTFDSVQEDYRDMIFEILGWFMVEEFEEGTEISPLPRIFFQVFNKFIGGCW